MDHLVEIAVVEYPGAMQSAVLGLQDVFAFAGQAGGGAVAVHVLSRFERETRRFDAIILPPSMGEVRAEDVPELTLFLKRQHEAGAVVCSACTGLTFVAASGLAGARPVTTHWALQTRLKHAYPGLTLDTDSILIEYGDLITAGGLMAWIDLALALVERFLGYGVAVQTARHFIVEFRRRDQRRFRRFMPDLRHGDRAILKVQHALEKHSASGVSAGELAAIAGLPARTFLRRFKLATGLSPVHYLQELRMERARELLIETEDSVSEICFSVGYNDVPSFSRLFTRLSGLSPGSFRDQYRRQGSRASEGTSRSGDIDQRHDSARP
ncbi:helix-turn-helix domain-containing protein [Rhodobacterales bacterium]|nr:helix-turn-helix domain-containing protein [Rhodobacterales bacterium]